MRQQSTTSSSRRASSTRCRHSSSVARGSTTGSSGGRGSAGVVDRRERRRRSRCTSATTTRMSQGGLARGALRRRGGAQPGARGRQAATLHDLRRVTPADSRGSASAATWAQRPAARERTQDRLEAPDAALACAGEPSGHPRPEPVLPARRRGDRQPARRPLRGARRGATMSPSSPGGCRAAMTFPQTCSQRRARVARRGRRPSIGRSSAIARVNYVTYLGRQLRSRAHARAPGPRALHDRSADRRRLARRSSRGAFGRRCS